ncbi:hypothetical protein PRUB_a4668 [Pseudoalteromonas rubra]|uniref:Uncharacterized protein n=1 Tax=Pseudoalteromonas rubra TaxID=43658 RepID=A0A8T0CB06_9GAMM|nr:hypothetical protein PRUB_a4668 [Pseudoalteromonas rubra]
MIRCSILDKFISIPYMKCCDTFAADQVDFHDFTLCDLRDLA